MRFRRPVLRVWQRLLLVWPGVFPLLPLLAALLGATPGAPDHVPRWSAGRVTPALPELRPAPVPESPVPFAAPPVAQTLAAAPPPTRPGREAPVWTAPERRISLSELGRRQADGG